MGNLENLTAEDLMYMIYNRNNFSLTTSSFIHFNENEWLNKIEKELSSDTINDIKDKTKNVNKLCEEIKDSLKEKFKNSSLYHLFDTIKHLKFETKENIFNAIKYFNRCCIDTFSKYNMKKSSKEYLFIKDIIKIFYIEILPWKMRTNDIYKKLNTVNFEYDQSLSSICKESITEYIIPNIISDMHSPKYIAYNIYLLYKLFVSNIDEQGLDRDFIDDLCKLSSIINVSQNFYYDVKNNVYGYIDNPDTNRIDIDITDDYDYNNDDVVTKYLNNLDNKKSIENFIESDKKINMVLNDKTIIFGDYVLTDDISPDRVLTEIKILEDDIERNYEEIKDSIAPELSRIELEYIKNSKLPLCKVVLPDGRKYNLTKVDNRTFCLFRSLNGLKLIGFSIPSGFNDKRLFFQNDINE